MVICFSHALCSAVRPSKAATCIGLSGGVLEKGRILEGFTPSEAGVNAERLRMYLQHM